MHVNLKYRLVHCSVQRLKTDVMQCQEAVKVKVPGPCQAVALPAGHCTHAAVKAMLPESVRAREWVGPTRL